MNLSFLLYEFVQWILTIIPILIPLVAILLLFFPPRFLVLVLLFLLGFQTFFIDVGVTLTIQKVLVFFAFITLLLFMPSDLSNVINKYPAKEILLILILFFIASALINIPYFPIKSMVTALGSSGDALFRDRATRELTQICMFILKATIPVIIIAVAKSRKIVEKMFIILVFGTTTLSVYGIYQYFAYLYDLPAIYIYRGDVGPGGGIGLFGTPWGLILRISSLAGEPKELAGILLPVILLLGLALYFFPSRYLKNYITKPFLFVLFLLHLLIFIFTFSTAGWLGGIIAISAVILLAWQRISKTRTVLIVLASLLVIFGLYLYVPLINSVVQDRILERVGGSFFEDSNYGASQLLHMYKVWPHTIFIGASLGGAIFYEQYVEQPESPIFYLFDYGVIGIIVFAIFLIVVYQTNKKFILNNLAHDPLALSVVYAMGGTITANFIFPKMDATLILWVLIGLCGAIIRVETDRQKKELDNFTQTEKVLQLRLGNQ